MGNNRLSFKLFSCHSCSDACNRSGGAVLSWEGGWRVTSEGVGGGLTLVVASFMSRKDGCGTQMAVLLQDKHGTKHIRALFAGSELMNHCNSSGNVPQNCHKNCPRKCQLGCESDTERLRQFRCLRRGKQLKSQTCVGGSWIKWERPISVFFQLPVANDN